MNLSPLQKLDKVLEILNEKQEATVTTIALTAPDVAQNNNELLLILSKLIKDDYAEKIQLNEFESPYTVTRYKITFEGRVFIEQGGYTSEQEIIASEKSWVKSTTSFQLGQTGYLNRLTVWIAVASCIAALYYLYFLIQDICWCEFVWQKH